MPTGSCFCKRLTYEYTGDVQCALCHCHLCRRISGSAFSTNLLVPTASFTLTSGAPKALRATGGSGKPLTLFFCGDCGVALYSDVEAMPGVTVVKAGSLDHPALLAAKRPALEIYARDRLGWLPDLAERTMEAGL